MNVAALIKLTGLAISMWNGVSWIIPESFGGPIEFTGIDRLKGVTVRNEAKVKWAECRDESKQIDDRHDQIKTEILVEIIGDLQDGMG